MRRDSQPHRLRVRESCGLVSAVNTLRCTGNESREVGDKECVCG